MVIGQRPRLPGYSLGNPGLWYLLPKPQDPWSCRSQIITGNKRRRELSLSTRPGARQPLIPGEDSKAAGGFFPGSQRQTLIFFHQSKGDLFSILSISQKKLLSAFGCALGWPDPFPPIPSQADDSRWSHRSLHIWAFSAPRAARALLSYSRDLL